MPRDRYEPIKLTQTTRYAGYQFHARVHVSGMQSFEAFKYLILSVLEWVRKRIPEEDRGVPELALPPAENYAEADTDLFRPYHFSVGYALDITPLMYEGIWALRLKEPDSRDKEDVVAGRFFTTRIGLRLSDKGYTEMGIRIDVTDPASVEKEVDFAFRPAFVRSLAVQPSVSFEQISELRRGVPEKVETEEDYKRFLYMLDNEDNQLPLVVFTHFRPGWKEEKKPAAGMSMEDFVKNDPMKSFLPFSGVQMPGMGMRPSGFDVDKAGFKMPEMPTSGSSKKPRAVLERVVTMEKAADTEPSAQTKKSVPAAEPPVMPFDTAAFSSSSFAYARTYVLGDAFFEKLHGKLKKEFLPGDILVCGARKFRGGMTVIGWPGDKEEELKKAYAEALLAAQSYSKHKAPYDYGSVIFEAEARKMAQQREFRTIIEGQYEDKEKYDRLVELYQELSKAVGEKDEKIDRLEKQCAEEFARGEAFRENEILDCEEEIAQLKKDLSDEEEKNRQMQSVYQQAKSVLDALEQIRKVEKLPVDNAGVVRYFKQVYPDRLGFTERGESEASSCDLDARHLWEILYMVANDLTDLFRSVQGNLKEEDVTRVAGCEMSFKEGSMTRKDSDFMRLREDEYEGKTISVEPHLKLKSWKGEPAHQRLHFCYDPELKKIIIGYLGDHLDSAATRYAGQR